jgi:radical SAM superfamily enzyme YgiQ (UPF0313 family)
MSFLSYRAWLPVQMHILRHVYIVQGRKLRRRSPQRFVDELEFLVNEKNQRFFTFMDDNLTVDNKHILGICNEILRRGLDIQFTTAGGLDEQPENRSD